MSLSRVQLYSQLYFLKINRLTMERNNRNKLLKSISAITGISDRSLSRVLERLQQNPEDSYGICAKREKRLMTFTLFVPVKSMKYALRILERSEERIVSEVMSWC